MPIQRNYLAKHKARQSKGRIASLSAHSRRRAASRARGANVGDRSIREPFAPPEDWYEPVGTTDYRIIVQSPGNGYRHIVTPEEVRERLLRVPSQYLKDLEVIQLSCVTRKKESFPCYGMQWGATLYLYPLEESLVEHFYFPPRPNLVNEAKMFGGRWHQPKPDVWTLSWTEKSSRDFYLNNILIHELGHLVDNRNSSYTDRERFAEWFAIEYGYRRSGGQKARRTGGKTRRRHHSC